MTIHPKDLEVILRFYSSHVRRVNQFIVKKNQEKLKIEKVNIFRSSGVLAPGKSKVQSTGHYSE